MMANDPKAYPFVIDVRKSPVEIRNAYGVYLADMHIPEGLTGENLAVKAVFKDRIIDIHWDGRVVVNPVEGEAVEV